MRRGRTVPHDRTRAVVALGVLFVGACLGAGVGVGTTAPLERASAVPAGAELNLRDQAAGVVRAVSVVGRTAYVGVGHRLETYDLSDLRAPRRLGRSAFLPRPARDIALAGTVALVGAGSLVVVDVADPTAPRIVWNVDALRDVRALVVDGALAYALDDRALSVLDLANPARPRVVGSLPVQAVSLAVRGHTAYVGVLYEGVHVVDVTDPTRPRDAAPVIGDETWEPYALAVHGTHLFEANFDVLRVLDLTDPARARVVASIDTPDTYAHSGDWRADIAFRGDRAFVTGRSDLRVFDVSDPAAPELSAGIAAHACFEQIAVDGDAALIADIDAGLRVLDVGDAHTPRHVGLIASRHVAGVTATLAAAFAYAGDQTAETDTIAAFDVPDDGSLVARGRVASPTVHGIAIAGRTGYVACGESGLVIVDVADPAAPSLLARIEPPGRSVRAIGVVGSRVILGDTFAGLAVLDAVGAGSVALRGAAELPGAPIQLVPRGRIVYVAHGYTGMSAVDIGDPAAPRVTGRFNPDPDGEGIGRYDVLDVAIDGATAYLLTADAHVVAVDASDPAHMRELASVTIGGDPSAIAAWDGVVYVTSNHAGAAPGELRALDVRDPAAPLLLARFATPGDAGDVAVYGGNVLVADGDAGLLRLALARWADTPTPDEPTIEPTSSPSATPDAALPFHAHIPFARRPLR